MQKITPFLWFDNNAEEAVEFYFSVFKNNRRFAITRYPEGAPGPKGSVMTAHFSLDGQEFIALNGGPDFKFTPAISFVISCETQEEVDYYWKRLSEGGREIECGWLEDRFGLCWQVVPNIMWQLLTDSDPGVAQRAMAAMMQMKKIEIAPLLKARDAG